MTCFLARIYFYPLCWTLGGPFQSRNITFSSIKFISITLMICCSLFSLFCLSRAPITGSLELQNCSSNFIFSCLFLRLFAQLRYVLNFLSNSSELFLCAIIFLIFKSSFYYECSLFTHSAFMDIVIFMYAESVLTVVVVLKFFSPCIAYFFQVVFYPLGFFPSCILSISFFHMFPQMCGDQK